ncbi:hypothetical protein DIURU_000871 [Diutina rugosa]|uniref:Uncharacterized protein n=1 Tax=Diutina rugosa TaxID=5481 RepID=A0A642UX92_DIURU|nr:uncharacterized protein DIURU_000871 [Diutina rugosa]KAA8907187.1 hypothetical protein DIURU_000871 [Diutina rugosa]
MNFYSHSVSYQTQQKLLSQMETDNHVLGNEKEETKVDKSKGDINYSYNRNMAKVVAFNHKMSAKLARKRQKASATSSDGDDTVSKSTMVFSDISSIFSRRTKSTKASASASTKSTKR